MTAEEQHALLIRIDERVGILIEDNKIQDRRLRGLERLRNWGYGALASSGLGYGALKYLPAIPL